MWVFAQQELYLANYGAVVMTVECTKGKNLLAGCGAVGNDCGVQIKQEYHLADWCSCKDCGVQKCQ